jgi:hypothetical protein
MSNTLRSGLARTAELAGSFILAGSPHLEETLRVGQEVLPLVHAAPVREALTAAEVAVAQVA